MKMSDYGPFVPLNKEQSEILTSILQCYRDDQVYFASRFIELYRDYDPGKLETIIRDLVSYGYLTDCQTIYPTNLARHRRYWHWLYWKYRLVVPLFVSILGTIVTNLLLYAIDWQTVLSKISILK